jgi:hypothetical protein
MAIQVQQSGFRAVERPIRRLIQFHLLLLASLLLHGSLLLLAFYFHPFLAVLLLLTSPVDHLSLVRLSALLLL